jgi:hypothetical protein
MKKIAGLIFAILLVMGLYCTVSADANVTLSLSDASATAGDEFSVDLKISNNTGLSMFSTQVIFDSSIITPVSFTANSTCGISFQTSLDDATADKNIVYIVQINGTAQNLKSTYNGVLGTLKFKVKDNAPTGNIVIDFVSDETTVCDSSYDDVDFTLESSKLNITAKSTNTNENVALILKDVTGARKLTDSEKSDFGITDDATVLDAINRLK